MARAARRTFFDSDDVDVAFHVALEAGERESEQDREDEDDDPQSDLSGREHRDAGDRGQGDRAVAEDRDPADVTTPDTRSASRGIDRDSPRLTTTTQWHSVPRPEFDYSLSR